MRNAGKAYSKAASRRTTSELVRLRNDPALPLHLVYNPVGAFLPSPQEELEADYKQELQRHFGIVFNRLYTLTNLPIGRFAVTCAAAIGSMSTCNS